MLQYNYNDKHMDILSVNYYCILTHSAHERLLGDVTHYIYIYVHTYALIKQTT